MRSTLTCWSYRNLSELGLSYFVGEKKGRWLYEKIKTFQKTNPVKILLKNALQFRFARQYNERADLHAKITKVIDLVLYNIMIFKRTLHQREWLQSVLKMHNCTIAMIVRSE